MKPLPDWRCWQCKEYGLTLSDDILQCANGCGAIGILNEVTGTAVIRDEGESVQSFALRLQRDFGAYNLKLATNYFRGGEVLWSKHLTPQGTGATPEDDIGVMTHRTILPCELMLDIDKLEGMESLIFKDLKEKAKWVCEQCRREFKNEPIVHWTGSKSHHISVIIPELMGMGTDARKGFREKYCEKWCCDMGKADERNMISLELAPHYKSGKVKKRVIL